MKAIFPKLNKVHIKKHLKKLQSFQLFSVDYTYHNETLRLIKWFVSKNCYIQLQNIIAIIEIYVGHTADVVNVLS